MVGVEDGEPRDHRTTRHNGACARGAPPRGLYSATAKTDVTFPSRPIRRHHILLFVFQLVRIVVLILCMCSIQKRGETPTDRVGENVHRRARIIARIIFHRERT